MVQPEAMMTALESIDTVFVGLAAHLKPRGFSKSGSRLYTRFDRGLKIIELQRSQWNSADKAKFTFELAAYYPALHELDRDEPRWPMANVRASLPRREELNGSPRQRIGIVMPRKWDDWWEVEAGGDRTALLANVQASVVEHALPWLDQHADLAWLANHYRGFTLQGAARCYVLLGQPEHARDCLREELAKENYSDAARDRWRRWAELVGVPPW